MKCGKSLTKNLKNSDLCLESAFRIEINKVSEDLAYQKCSSYFDNIHEIHFKNGIEFCRSQGCSSPIIKEIQPAYVENRFSQINNQKIQKKNLLSKNRLKNNVYRLPILLR